MEEEFLSEGEDEKSHSIVGKLPTFSKAGISQPGKIEDDVLERMAETSMPSHIFAQMVVVVLRYYQARTEESCGEGN